MARRLIVVVVVKPFSQIGVDVDGSWGNTLDSDYFNIRLTKQANASKMSVEYGNSSILASLARSRN